jgi:hypothetical protein
VHWRYIEGFVVVGILLYDADVLLLCQASIVVVPRRIRAAIALGVRSSIKVN